MISSRKFLTTDLPKLQSAIDADSFHPGLWKVEDFSEANAWYEVFEDQHGIIVFVKYTVDSHTRIRIHTVWADFNDSHRNARAIVIGINQMVQRLLGSQFEELIFSTEHDKLAAFCTNVLGFDKINENEYTKKVKGN
jgi:hypothetical protein